MLCVSVVVDVIRFLSVRLSVTLVYCIQVAKDIIKLLFQSGSPLFWVLDPER